MKYKNFVKAYLKKKPCGKESQFMNVYLEEFTKDELIKIINLIAAENNKYIKSQMR